MKHGLNVGPPPLPAASTVVQRVPRSCASPATTPSTGQMRADFRAPRNEPYSGRRPMTLVFVSQWYMCFQCDATGTLDMRISPPCPLRSLWFYMTAFLVFMPGNAYCYSVLLSLFVLTLIVTIHTSHVIDNCFSPISYDKTSSININLKKLLLVVHIK